MSATVSIPLGVVIAREDIDSRWQDHVWRPIGILPGAPPVGDWREMQRGEGWVHYHAATVPLELFAKETEAYKYNLEGREPSIFIVFSGEEDEENDRPLSVHLATASPYEAADYLDSGEQTVEPVAMTPELLALVSEFVGAHHVEEKFKKRKNIKVKPEEYKFGQEPIVELRKRMRMRQASEHE